MKTQHDGRGLAAFNIHPPTYMALNMPRDSEELRTRSRILTHLTDTDYYCLPSEMGKLWHTKAKQLKYRRTKSGLQIPTCNG